jgi:hypothetical protein
MLPRVSAPRSLAVTVVLLSACTGSPPEGSNLEKRSAPATPPANPPPVAATTPPPATPPSPANTPPAPVDANALTAEPPAGTELMPVRLALKDASVYRVTTVGNVAMSGLMSPTAYAREEQLELSDCAGEGDARRCLLTHRYRKFEAEPPAGRIYESDEKLVSSLVTSHTLLASGARDGATAVTGPAEQADAPAGKALADVHRFYCIRFPARPIGVGAKWRDRCHTRTGGSVDTRDVVWELTKLDTVDGQRRAELTYLGDYTAPGPKGDRKGVVSGVLHFMVDPGEPHLLKEQISLKTAETGTTLSTTTIAYQFARVTTDKKGKEKLVRTDGADFPAPAAPPPPDAKAAKKKPAKDPT